MPSAVSQCKGTMSHLIKIFCVVLEEHTALKMEATGTSLPDYMLLILGLSVFASRSFLTAMITLCRLVNNEVEWIWKEQSWPCSKYYPGILLEELSKTTIPSVQMADLWAKV